MLDLPLMVSPHMLRRLAPCLALLAACQVKDDDDSGASSPTDTTDAMTGEPTNDTGTSDHGSGMAFLRADKPPSKDPNPPPGAPDDLLVDVATFAMFCADPYAFPGCGPETYVRYSFVLSPDRQQPGVYAGDDLGAWVDLQSSEGSPCEGNGPFDVGGTVEIVSITADQLVVRLTAMNDDVRGAEGEYTVERCAG